MKRHSIIPRHNWKQKVEEHGMLFHTINDEVYWDESCYYEFSLKQIDEIEDATNELHGMCLNAIENVIRKKEYSDFCIPDYAIPMIESSWKNAEESFYGRFDFSYDGKYPPKLLEYNADTPTALMEASVSQWFWLQDRFPHEDQFNSIDEKLLDLFKRLKNVDKMYFSCLDSDEDYMTVMYLQDAAIRAGKFQSGFIPMHDIGYDKESGEFVDMDNKVIRNLFKLYPWENMIQDSFGRNIANSSMKVYEPAWKMLLSNKALMVKLWEMFPNHPNLLRAEYFPFSKDYVKKPIHSREGANITIVMNGSEFQKTDGDYGDKKFIYQDFCPLPDFLGNYPVIGSWVINNVACGMGIREDKTLITKNTSRFVPHLFKD